MRRKGYPSGPFAPFWEKERALRSMSKKAADFHRRNDVFLPFWERDKARDDKKK